MADVEVGAIAPETPVAAPVLPEATQQPDPTAGQVETPPGEKPEAPPEKMLPQSEVNKLIAKEKAQAEKRAMRIARAEAEARFYKEQLESRQQTQAQGDDPEPREEDFANKPYRDFLKAQARWEIRQELKAERERNAREGRQQQQTQRVQQEAQYVHERLITKGQEAHDDFDDVVLADHVPVSPAMIAAAAKLDNGFDVLYHLCKNDREIQRIARLSDVEQAWELRDFAQKLKAPPKTTNAPPPIRPNETNAKASTGYRADMTDKEFDEWRRRSIAQRR